MKKALTAAATAMQGRGKRTMILYREGGRMSMDYDELQDRLDELMDIQSMLNEASRRMEDLDVMPEDLEKEIARCEMELARNERENTEALRREYERSVL